MAHTNQTAHYHLPQYVGTDIINPLTDTNKAYEDIDTALYEQGQNIADANDDIDALKIQNGDSALDTTAQTLSGAINELKSGADALGDRVTANETNISTLQTQMSTATGNITTLNTTVSGLQTEVASKASATALDNLTTKVGTGNLDTVAQNCVDAINEIKASSVVASGVSYDNTGSGLVATNVQSAIDEVNAKIPVSGNSYAVNGDGTKTWAQLLTELETALGNTPLTMGSYIEHHSSNGAHIRYGIVINGATSKKFSYAQSTTTGGTIVAIDLKTHEKYTLQLSPSATVVTPQSTDVVTSGDVITLYV